jgi:hypothetical protein
VKEQNKTLYLEEKRTRLYTIIARDTGHDYDVLECDSEKVSAATWQWPWAIRTDKSYQCWHRGAVNSMSNPNKIENILYA